MRHVIIWAKFWEEMKKYIIVIWALVKEWNETLRRLWNFRNENEREKDKVTPREMNELWEQGAYL